MANADIPHFTRLRFVKSKQPEVITAWLERLQLRVQIYGSPQWTGEAWYLWFVPDDRGADIPSIDLTEI